MLGSKTMFTRKTLDVFATQLCSNPVCYSDKIWPNSEPTLNKFLTIDVYNMLWLTLCDMSDLTDKEWSIIESIFTEAKKGKHLQKHSKRKIVNVVRYLSKTGCQ